MSEIHRVNPPQPGTSIPPVRPTRKPGREPKKRREGRRPPARDAEDAPASEPAGDEDPSKGSSIDLRV